MSATKLLVADAAAFCAKHGQIRSEKQFRQVTLNSNCPLIGCRARIVSWHLGALASRRRVENEPKAIAGETPALPGMTLRFEFRILNDL